jgi:hypothetical protein
MRLFAIVRVLPIHDHTIHLDGTLVVDMKPIGPGASMILNLARFRSGVTSGVG